jgi:hypothetical protein
MRLPLLDPTRAMHELGWVPRHSSVEALEQLLVGIEHGDGADTPPLVPDSLGARIEELRAGVGSRDRG